MPRPDRLDFKGAIHYTRIRGGPGADVFFDPAILKSGGTPSSRSAPHVRQFERLVAAVGEECLVVLHGYSLEPNRGTLVLQTTGAPLEAFMRRLCGQYSRYLRMSVGLSRDGSTFPSRYESKVIAPEYLPHAVRRAHRAPILAGLCRSRVDYPFSTERVYLGEDAYLPIATREVRTALGNRGLFGARGYREFMDAPENPYVTHLFEHGTPGDPRIVGGKLFAKQVRQLIARPAAVPTREEHISAVARLLQVSEAQILSHTRTGVLGRSLVAWYALRSGTATLSEVGRWFSVTGATLGQGIRHYRKVEPNLFRQASPL